MASYGYARVSTLDQDLTIPKQTSGSDHLSQESGPAFSPPRTDSADQSGGGERTEPTGKTPRLRVLLLLAHPRRVSLCGALADAYAEGARCAGVDLRRCDLAALRFALNVTTVSPSDQFCEDDICSAMQAITWANHLVIVFPTWWGTMPALLKGFLDRVMVPGFAFAERADGEGWERLLTGRSAHLLTTMDTPPWVYRWIYRAPGLNGLAKATLGFCGITPVQRTIFGPVKGSSETMRRQWIAQARQKGAQLADGALTRGASIRRQVGAWVAALRLQFHPMAWIAYLIGALGAWHSDRPVQAAPFWLGLACLFSLEAATVFANDYFDQPSDSINRHYGPFTGGSRMLVEARISPAQMRRGIAVALTAFGILGAVLCLMTPWLMAPFLIANAILAIGYTVPPMRLCWRGLGEIDVALTHSFSVLLWGSLAQGEAIGVPFPWLIGLPLFFAVLPAIILSGLPDFEADRASDKRSMAVCWGPYRAALIAELATVAAAVTSLTWLPALGVAAMPAICIVVAYAAVQVIYLGRYRAAGARPRRIDRLMVLCLSFILLFVVSPLILVLIT